MHVPCLIVYDKKKYFSSVIHWSNIPIQLVKKKKKKTLYKRSYIDLSLVEVDSRLFSGLRTKSQNH